MMFLFVVECDVCKTGYDGDKCQISKKYDCNNNGGTLMCGFAKIWGGTNQSYGRGGICEQGVPGIPAVAGGGNCYCGGSGGAGTYMFWYK